MAETNIKEKKENKKKEEEGLAQGRSCWCSFCRRCLDPRIVPRIPGCLLCWFACLFIGEEAALIFLFSLGLFFLFSLEFLEGNCVFLISWLPEYVGELAEVYTGVSELSHVFVVRGDSC